MAAPGLHALSCSKCGASLSLAPGQQLLTCQYCAQAHVFVPPPRPERAGTAYAAGERVAVEWGGHWWPATLLRAVGPYEWKVDLDGWDHLQHDVVVGPSRIRHISQAMSRMSGMKPVLVLYVVIGMLVFVVGGSLVLRELHSEAPVAVQAPAAEPPAAPDPYREGERVQIEWQGGWFPGTIIEVNGSRYKVTYDGYSSSWDEWVDASRLQKP